MAPPDVRSGYCLSLQNQGSEVSSIAQVKLDSNATIAIGAKGFCLAARYGTCAYNCGEVRIQSVNGAPNPKNVIFFFQPESPPNIPPIIQRDPSAIW